MNYNVKNSLFENNFLEKFNNNNFEVVNNTKSLLISKKIENYFDDLIKVPDVAQNGGVTSTSFSFSNFYKEYIEHNILLLFIIMCLVIFLIVKYINKHYYSFTTTPIQNDNKYENYKYENYSYDDDDTDEIEENKKKYIKKKLEKQKLLKLKKENERQKHLLELEKQSIMDIIDELSNINNQKINKNIKLINNENFNNEPDDNIYYNNNNNYYNDNYNNYNNNQMFIDRNYLDENQSNFSKYSLISSNDMDFNDGYYTVNRNINFKDKKSPNYVKGMYIESPFQE